jgi:hypothetical protein
MKMNFKTVFKTILVPFTFLILLACQKTFKANEANVTHQPPDKIVLKSYPLPAESITLNDGSIFFWKDESQMTPDQVAQVQSISNSMDEDKASLINSNLALKNLSNQHDESVKSLSEEQKNDLDAIETKIKSLQKNMDYTQKQIDAENSKLESGRDNNKIQKYQKKLDIYSKDQLTAYNDMELKFGAPLKELNQAINTQVLNDKKLNTVVSAKFDELFKKLDSLVVGITAPPNFLKIENNNKNNKGVLSIVLSWDKLAENCTMCSDLSVENGNVQNLKYEERGGVLSFDLIHPITQEVYSFELNRTKDDDVLHRICFQGKVTVNKDSAQVKYGIASFTTKIDLGTY